MDIHPLTLVGILIGLLSLLMFLTPKKRGNAPVEILMLIHPRYESLREKLQRVLSATMVQFPVNMDGASEDSKRTQFEYVQRNLVMRLRHADAPGDVILCWTLWDGSVLEYKLEEALI